MATKSSAYWRKRFEQLEKAQLNKGITAYHELEKQYTQAARAVEKEILAWYSRYAKENKITLSEAKKLLAGRDLEAFRMDVKEYIKKGASLDPKWAKQLEQASVRVHVSRLEALKTQMQQQIERLHGHELDALDKVARDIYTDGYYRTAFEVAKGSGVSATFAALDTKKIDKVISNPWAPDGSNFSKRIWEKRSTLVNDLHTLLTQNIIKGDSPDKLIKLIARKFDVSKHQAGRLIMTESAYFNSAAQYDSFKEVGVEKFEFVATLDTRTSEICEEMDGQVFNMSEYEIGVNAPPLHCNCRSTTVPYFADLGGERASRDSKGKYKTVPADMTYKDWKDKFVESVADTVVSATVTKVLTPVAEAKQQIETYNASRQPINHDVTPERLLDELEHNKHITKEVKEWRSWGADGEDVHTKALLSETDYLDKPVVLDAKDFDALGDDYVKVYRGVKNTADKTAKAINDEYRYAEKAYVGRGLYGGGTYTTPHLESARGYGSDDILELAFDKNARIINFKDLNKKHIEVVNLTNGVNEPVGKLLSSKYADKELPAIRSLLFNESKIAQEMGYDIIKVDFDNWGRYLNDLEEYLAKYGEEFKQPYYVILNRKVVIVKKGQ